MNLEEIKARRDHLKACADHAPPDVLNHASTDIDWLITELENELAQYKSDDPTAEEIAEFIASNPVLSEAEEAALQRATDQFPRTLKEMTRRLKVESERNQLRTQLATVTTNINELQCQNTILYASIATVTAERDELRGQWTANLPTEQDSYWWWNGDEDSAPIHIEIMYSGHSDTCFAPMGQYGWTEAQDVSDMGGFWMRLPTPNPPSREQIAAMQKEGKSI